MVTEIVIDASVAAKWFYRVKEQYVEEALSLFDQTALGHIRFVVPDLFFFELGNVFVNDKTLSEEHLKQHWETLEDLGVESSTVHGVLFAKTHRAAREYRLTFYDAAYLAVAQERSIPLVTEDRELLRMKLPFVVSLARFAKKL